jgi:hypothetical protein
MRLTKRNRRGPDSPFWRGAGEISGGFWSRILSDAARRAIDVSISISDAWRVALLQEMKCALTRQKMEFQEPCRTASLDRIDSGKGYSIENVHWVHKHVNKMKWHLSIEHFIVMCNLISSLPSRSLAELHVPSVPPLHPARRDRGSYMLIPGKMWTAIRRRSVKAGVEFNLFIDRAWDLYVSQNCRCALTGIPIYFNLPGCSSSGTASLDRINSDAGYISGNVQWVHKDANLIKCEFSYEYVCDICRMVSSAHPRMMECLGFLWPSREWEESFKPCRASERIASYMRSRPSFRDGTSRFKGVSRNLRDGSWHVRFSAGGRLLFEQSFDDEIEAARHYDFFAIQHYGKGACFLNFPEFDYSGFTPRIPGQKRIFRARRKSKFKGVHVATKKGKQWRAVVCLADGRKKVVGQFDTEIDAARNYDYHILKLRGGGSVLNFPGHDYSSFEPLVREIGA